MTWTLVFWNWQWLGSGWLSKTRLTFGTVRACISLLILQRFVLMAIWELGINFWWSPCPLQGQQCWRDFAQLARVPSARVAIQSLLLQLTLQSLDYIFLCRRLHSMEVVLCSTIIWGSTKVQQKFVAFTLPSCDLPLPLLTSSTIIMLMESKGLLGDWHVAGDLPGTRQPQLETRAVHVPRLSLCQIHLYCSPLLHSPPSPPLAFLFF